MNKKLRNFTNLIISGIGLGIIIGSIINILEPKNIEPNSYKKDMHHKSKNIYKNDFILSNYNKEIIELSNRWREIAENNKDLKISAFILFLDNYTFAEFNSKDILPAASAIKIPILILALEMLDNKEIILNEAIELKETLKASGSGWIRYEQNGTIFPLHQLATEMIRISDNTATNLLIERMGGVDLINKRINKIGLQNTVINNLLPDLEGSNTTSAMDLVLAISLVDSGEFLSQRSRDLFREIMSTSTSNKLLPGGILQGLGHSLNNNIDNKLSIQGYRVYNKTGDIGISYADAGLIQMPDNTRAVASFIVQGPFNDPRSPETIRNMAKAIVDVINPKSVLDSFNGDND